MLTSCSSVLHLLIWSLILELMTDTQLFPLSSMLIVGMRSCNFVFFFFPHVWLYRYLIHILAFYPCGKQTKKRSSLECHELDCGVLEMETKVVCMKS